MKKLFLILGSVVLAGIFIWTFVYLYQQSQAKNETYTTEKPVITNIVKKSVAAGSIVPRREVIIKPRVSGIIEQIYVQPGEFIKSGQLIAYVRIIPNMITLNSAEANLKQIKLNYDDAKRELQRNESLYKDKLIAETDYNRFLLAFNQSREELAEAGNNLQLIREGSTSKTEKANNRIYSTVTGMILDIPVREGTSVIESNNFNEGTTIATIADMNDMLFVGKIDESEVDKIRENMDLILNVGAIEGKSFPAKLNFISPKGVDVEGAIQFEVKATVQLPKDEFIRAGYSATADIVLNKATNVLAISEKLVQFENKDAYVEIEETPQVFKKKKITLGLSDGLMVEVKNGIDKEDRIKVFMKMDTTKTNKK